MKTLIKNGKLLVYDNSRFNVIDGDLVIEDELISRILKQDGSVPYDVYDKVIDATGRLVMPGLINAHTHAYMSIFRNYADDLDFFDWLEKVQLVEDRMIPEDAYWTSLLSVIEMFRTGTTCCVDMHMYCATGDKTKGPEGACAAAVNDSGIRAYLNRGIVGDKGDEGSERRLREFFSDVELYRDNNDGRISFLLGPHAPYSCSQSLLGHIADICREKGMMATIHISESDAEVEGIARDNSGVTPVKYVADSGLLDVPVIAAHCVKVTEDDIRILKEHNVNVAVNPRSNMKLGNGFAPVPEMMEAGINICLGTDGSGSNNTQNMFQEMNAAALVYKGAKGRSRCVDARDVLEFATVNGAKALGMDGKLGIIKEGALADIIILDLNVPEFVPQNDIISGLVYSANGSEVRTVIINGRTVMEEGRILTVSEQEVYDNCERICRKLMKKQRTDL